MSNFLLWQSAYACIYIADVYWPALSRGEIEEASSRSANPENSPTEGSLNMIEGCKQHAASGAYSCLHFTPFISSISASICDLLETR